MTIGAIGQLVKQLSLFLMDKPRSRRLTNVLIALYPTSSQTMATKVTKHNAKQSRNVLVKERSLAASIL